MMFEAMVLKGAYDRCDRAGKAAFLGTMEYFAWSVVGGAAVGAVAGGITNGVGGAIIGACLGGPVVGPVAGTALLVATLAGRGILGVGGALLSGVANMEAALSDAATKAYVKKQRRAEFQAFGMDAKTASLVAEVLHTSDSRKFSHLATKAASVHAEMGDDGKGYIVSFTTDRGTQGTVTAMTPEKFDKFKAKVSKSDIPVTVTTFTPDRLVKEHFVGGGPLRLDPKNRSEWVPAKVEVIFDEIKDITPEQAGEALAQGAASKFTHCTFYSDKGEEMSYREAKELTQLHAYHRRGHPGYR